MSARPPFGLVLAGGRSARMGRDKATLDYHGRPQVDVCFELLAGCCPRVYVSVRPDQADAELYRNRPLMLDHEPGLGPIAGLLAAFAAHPDEAWLAVACDLPFLRREVIEHLLAHRDPARVATAYRSRHDGLPEPLCAVYEPAMHTRLRDFVRQGITCPRKALIRSDTLLLDLPDPRALDNINRPEELAEARAALEVAARTIRVRFYAALREAAGVSELDVHTRAATARDLYAELQARYRLAWPADRFRVAIHDTLCPWDTRLSARDVVSFIPPSAGG